MATKPPLHKPKSAQSRTEQQREYDQYRAKDHAKAYDGAWRRLSKAHRTSFPLCAMCLKDEIVNAATEVDHIIPISQAPHLRLEPTNLQSLCHQHHAEKTAQERQGRQ